MRNELDMLRHALADGSISKAELQARLTAIIEEAYQRLPVDAAFIADCESLLQTVITGDAAASPSVAVDCWKAIRQHTRTRESLSLGWKGRLAVIAAVCLLLFCVTELNASNTWLGGKSAYGGTTYIIGHHRLQSGLTQAFAKNETDDNTWQELNTQSWEKLVDFLGDEPPTVDVTELGLDPQGCYSAIISSSHRYSTQTYSTYHLDGTVRWLGITIIDYADPQQIFYSFSQLRPGRNTMLSNGTEVYITTSWSGRSQPNGQGLSVIWLEGTRIYHLHGELTEAEMLAVAEALCGQAT